MRKQPLHRRFRVRIARSEERLLASHGRETHALELRYGGFVECGQLGGWG